MVGHSLANRTFRETFGQYDIRLEITFSSALWALQTLRERESDQCT